MDLKLQDKLALVSGSTQGIGLAIVKALAGESARVILNGRSQASVSRALERVSQSIPGAKLESFVGDLSNAATVENLVRQFPAVDILVNNLGIFEPKPFSAARYSLGTA